MAQDFIETYAFADVLRLNDEVKRIVHGVYASLIGEHVVLTW